MIVTLAFENADAILDEEVLCERDSVPLIMQWYESHHAGDNYTVFINGTPILKDMNGEYEPPTIGL